LGRLILKFYLREILKMTDINYQHNKLYLTNEQYINAMKRIRNLISDGKELIAIDDNTIGSKCTTCTWGLCSEEPDAWPDREDMLFPEQHPQRISVKYTETNQRCPIDERDLLNRDMNGCFFTCRIFKGKNLSRKEVIKLYDQRIIEAEKILNKSGE
jgi:hypothetical protein